MIVSNIFAKFLVIAHSVFAAIHLQIVEPLTFQGIWITTSFHASSNSDMDNNSRNNEHFESWWRDSLKRFPFRSTYFMGLFCIFGLLYAQAE